jgi:UDP-N-acetylmuramoyl-tripeptide--D-alanyl-D-alanine ligase
VVTVGSGEDVDIRALDASMDAHGRTSFTVVRGPNKSRVSLDLRGMHHVANALAAAAVGLECGFVAG